MLEHDLYRVMSKANQNNYFMPKWTEKSLGKGHRQSYKTQDFTSQMGTDLGECPTSRIPPRCPCVRSRRPGEGQQVTTEGEAIPQLDFRTELNSDKNDFLQLSKSFCC